MGTIAPDKNKNWGISESSLAKILTPSLIKKNLPDSIEIPTQIVESPLTVNYTFDLDLQSEVETLLKKHNPDYGVFVAINPDNGHVLAIADSVRNGTDRGNLALQNTFPAASISKIITAAAALNEGIATATTIIPFNGKATSLFKKNVFNHRNSKWTKHYSLKLSFAKSVNTVFGRLGAVKLGAEDFLKYSHQFGFNEKFNSDFDFGTGQIELDPTNSWQLAETAAGYTTRNTLSPVHAAVLGALAVNGGYLVAPVIVKSLTGPSGIPIYYHETPSKSSVLSKDSAQQLKTMMQATIKNGSARRAFRKFHKSYLSNVIAGGKTGSLTGHNPRGKYDWFVGFAEQGEKKIAYAMLCINKEKWYVKSTHFVREILQYYFRSSLT